MIAGDMTFDVGGVANGVVFAGRPCCPDAAVTVFDANTAARFGGGAASPVRPAPGKRPRAGRACTPC